jgi:tetratricopeptide (TPR) repeat protein
MRPWLTVLAAGGLVALVEAGGAGSLRGEPAAPSRPPWQRLLQGDDARKAQELEEQIEGLLQAGKFAEALASAEAVARLRAERQGKDHWEAVEARFTVEALRRVIAGGKKGREDYVAAGELANKAAALEQKGRHRDALPLREQVYAILREVLGEEHPETAANCHTLAVNLSAQARYKEALEHHQKALAARRKTLGEDHPGTAASYNGIATILQHQGRYTEAEALFRKALAIRLAAFGEEHLATANSYNNLGGDLSAQGRYADAEEFFRKSLTVERKLLGEANALTATAYNNVAFTLREQGRYAEAEEVFRKSLAIRREVLGEEHPDTAISYHNLAFAINSQGRYAEAGEGLQKALAIRRKVLGEDHPLTALSYDGVAANLNDQGRFREAEENHRKGLAIRLRVLGERHPETARSYVHLARNLDAQGKYAEAEEGYHKALDICRIALGEEHPLTGEVCASIALHLQERGRYADAAESYRKALAISRKVFGEEHPETAGRCNNLAGNLDAQGRHAEAEELCRKALAICRKMLGEDHPQTGNSYNHVANNLNAQHRYPEAEENYRKALAINRKVLGEDHPRTATSYNNLAGNLDAQGRHAEAEEDYRKGLEIRRKVLGEEHPDTAASYNNVATNLTAQGRYAEAEESSQKALTILQKALGEDHPRTAGCYTNMARNLNAAGRYADAEERWRRAADSFDRARLRMAASGLDRAAVTAAHSPLLPLSAVLARNGKAAEAWRRYEESLSRGTWEDLSARLRRPPAEQAKQAELIARLQRLDQRIEQALVPGKDTAGARRLREELLSQQRQLQDELAAFTAHLEKEYGPVAGVVSSVDAIQATLAPATALVGWIDLPPELPTAADPSGEHWAVLLRHSGPPVFERLRGTGPGGRWTREDESLARQLRQAILQPRLAWQELARQLREQRLGPLAAHLQAHDGLPAVQHLMVLPSTGLAGIPVELLAEGTTVSYAHSGTLFAYLRGLPKVKTEGLLALADPIFETVAPPGKEKPLPPGGVLVTVVQPGSSAAQSRLQPGDVLLRYNGKALACPADLGPLVTAAATGGKPVPVTAWRDGGTLNLEVPPGKLGVVLADKAAPEAVAEQRRLDRRLASRSGEDRWLELPGTRAEVDALQRLFPAAPAPLLLRDGDASEQKLYELARTGELKKYRYVHLATHGDVDDRLPLRSAVILSQDNLPDPGQQLLEGKPVFDGRLTVEEVLRQWTLDSDLVTLSACQSGLGKYETGEGFVGFAQALVLCGSRSVCLSLWKVDDAATALLMQRFYANLLGKREGLKAPLGKAAALAEAKRWLRTLSREQALKQAAAVYSGMERGKGRPKLPRLPSLPETPPEVKEDCPYAHPYFWAAFVLTGDPD